MEFNVGKMLMNRANLFGNKEGFVRDNIRLSFSDFNESANTIAHFLVEQGFVKGDKLAIICKNNEDFAAVFFAAAKIGVITVAINYKLQPKEVAFVVNHCYAKGVMYGDDHLKLVAAIKALVFVELYFTNDSAGEDTLVANIISSYGKQEPTYRSSGDDPILIMYTSGTTGEPKGAMLSHNNLISSAITLSSSISWWETDRYLHMVPLFHIAGFTPLITNVHTGATTVFLENFEPIQAWQVMEREKITTMMSMPEMLVSLIKAIDLMKPDFSTIRTITCGTSTVPQQIIHVFKQFGIPVQQVYGLTEFTGGLTIWRSEFDEQKYDSKGKLVMYSEIKVVSLETGEALQPHEDGEILCRGPQTFLGYFKDEESTKNALVDGWYHTGDIGHVDEEGFLYLVDRMKDIIVHNGEKIYSAEVENLLVSHFAVAQAAVIGVPRPDYGEIPIAYIVLAEGKVVTAAELIQYCKNELAAYKVVREIIFIEHLPRNAVGKILKDELRKQSRNAVQSK
ncbi:class I adenylate-forming enzyme family protein [Solibacillus sp. FSL H8-0538]|uniref:class I adenylate-forming enzyme family protein n=1 Tax=Solibacillus sp. FSL H8-0538 TaxID=2921400 RepID=UPI0030F6D485